MYTKPVNLIEKIRNKYTKPPLKLYRWRYDYPKWLNFGDELTTYLIERLYGRQTIWAPPPECQIAGAGSLIEILQRESNGNQIQVWGTGFIKDGPKNTLDNLHFHAVRGALSRSRVDGKDIALGDPGLLLPLAYQPKKIAKYKIGIIPNYVDQHLPILDSIRSRQDTTVINVFDPIEQIIREANSCELLLTSSLHGVILGDAYKIPNYWIPLSGNVVGKGYKFKDYYSIFGMEPQPLDPSNLDSLDYDKLISDYQPRPSLDEVQQQLLRAFPF